MAVKVTIQLSSSASFGVLKTSILEKLYIFSISCLFLTLYSPLCCCGDPEV